MLFNLLGGSCDHEAWFSVEKNSFCCVGKLPSFLARLNCGLFGGFVDCNLKVGGLELIFTRDMAKVR